MNTDRLPHDENEKNILLRTKRFNVQSMHEQCTDGSSRTREVVIHPGSVVIVPLVSAEEVCLIHVDRIAVGKKLIELPAGTLDRVESLSEAAFRELAEETGYSAGTLTPLGALWMSPGVIRERMHIFIAENLKPGPQALEPGEKISPLVVPWSEAIAMCADQRIQDAKTVAALYLVNHWKTQKKFF
ncbi:MAG: NUDIX hydrolase [Pirellulales bacterium]